MKFRVVFGVMMIVISALSSAGINFSVTRAVDYGGSGTTVGGIIWENTTWTLENSPYNITDTVQIPENVTLTIEPGVTVIKSKACDMFLLHGTIYAHGTIDNKIIFDGRGYYSLTIIGNTIVSGRTSFFNAENSNSNAFLDMDYCIVKNGVSFWWGGHGSFSLKHSELSNLIYYSYLWYPYRDAIIEYNKFINTNGISIGTDGDIKVYVRHNLFKKKYATFLIESEFCIKNWASYGESETIVKYNSFIDMDRIVLELPEGYDSAAMAATENYWETNDTAVIDSMIYDRNDHILCAGFIDYLPILSNPHPNTPILLEDIEGAINGSFKKDDDGKWRCYANLTIRNHSHKNVTIYWVYLNAINITYVDETFEELNIPGNETTNFVIQPEQEFSMNWTLTAYGFTKEPKTLWVLFKTPILEAYETITLTAIIPQFPSFLVLPLFMIATLLVVACMQQKIQYSERLKRER
jgi:hypothetical protein